MTDSRRYRDRSRSPARSGPSDAAKIAARKAKLAMWKAKKAANEKEEQERKAAEQEKKKMDEMLAKGHIPKSLKELIQDDDATESKADMEVEIPTNKLKRVIGPGGDIIRGIEKQSKCRIQHTKNDQEMGVAFGASYKTRVDAQSQTITLKLFGSQDACATARELIMNAVENKEQKAKQRAKEYEKKKEEKRAQRQIYHLRHARDYEALGNPNNREEAELKFQQINKAYESLMTTDEDQQRVSSSAKTVAELGISLANESELRASVASLPERLAEIKKALIETYKSHARDIAVQWRAGFSVLLYGRDRASEDIRHGESNIDGPSLRSLEQQRALSEFSRIPRLHFGASIDHVNAPLIWDLQTKDRFAWLWHHVPTFKPYIREASLSSLPSLFLGRKEACTQESAAVGLFNICKEKFLASNENTLKAFLTEFKDHDILQTRKMNDASDILCIPLEPGPLRQLLTIC
eukprot:jgi/Picre1/30164/NNA_005533.t1